MKELYAALDLGSNSFHMLTAAFEFGEIRVLDSISEKVMLAEGLSKETGISHVAQQRGIECIKRFAQRMESIPNQNIRVIGTNTLRAAVNAHEYLDQIQSLLGDVSIEIISGVEEARLIFQGVSHSWSSLDAKAKHLVVDIGGGSTEFIIGNLFSPKNAESLRMGCVSYRRFFPDEIIIRENFSQAVFAAELEVANIMEEYSSIEWTNVIGTAGTFKALERLSISLGFTEEGITAKSLKQLKTVLLSFSRFDSLDVPGLKSLRCKTILPGLAIATAIFKMLSINKMHVSRGGLREGILYELVGESTQGDIKVRSIKALCERYQISFKTRELLLSIKTQLLNKSELSLVLGLSLSDQNFLSWAISVAKIGLGVNHSQYQKHSAYLIENTELSGFSLMQRTLLSRYVLNHRRKMDIDFFLGKQKDKTELRKILFIILVLRLTYIFGQNGKINDCEQLSIRFDKNFILSFSEKWAIEYPLIRYALEKEVLIWQKMPMSLKLKNIDSSATNGG